MDADALLAGLDERQREAVVSTAAPLVVLAPAGSGKTRVLTHRIAHRVARGDIEPSHVLAVTFTRKAATELAGRLRRLGLRDRVTSGTFHAIALAQLTDHARDRGGRPPRILDRKRRLLESVADDRTAAAALAGAAPEIEWAKARLIPPATYAEAATVARRRSKLGIERTAELYRRYEVAKREQGLSDFDDLLFDTARLIEQDQAFADAQRWRFRHLFVDEFQDVNPLQFRLLEAWRGGHSDLFVVGDPQQAIYTWNGADPRFLLDIADHYPAISVVQLTSNYRSTRQILAAANSVLATAGLPLETAEPVLGDADPPVIVEHADGEAEAAAIATAIRRSHGPGRRWSDHAVLVRTHAQLTPIRDALSRFQVPFQVRGNERMADDPDVRRVLDALEHDDRPAPVALDDLVTPVEESETTAARAELSELVGEFVRGDPAGSGRDFVTWARANVERRNDRRRIDAVVLATFHAAKGLEWPMVHLAGLEDGYVPIGHARTREARAEEARLLYVAMTRAERELALHHAATRRHGHRMLERQRSALLAGVAAATSERTPMADPDRIRSARELLSPSIADGPGEHLVERLEEWRAHAARRARVSPEALLSDRAVRRIAAEQPTDVTTLAEISGLGPMTAERLAGEIFEVLAQTSATT